MKYRRKPLIIDAIQWTGDNQDKIKEFFGGRKLNENDRGIGTIAIHTLQGIIVAEKWDYLIKNVHNEFLPALHPEVFNERYEIIKD